MFPGVVLLVTSGGFCKAVYKILGMYEPQSIKPREVFPCCQDIDICYKAFRFENHSLIALAFTCESKLHNITLHTHHRVHNWGLFGGYKLNLKAF